MLWIYYGAVGVAVLLAGLSAIGAYGHGLDMDHDHDADADAEAPLLALLGIGRAPLSIMTISWLLTFGAAGILFMMLAESWLLGHEWYSLAFASGFSLAFTAIFARVLGRFVPSVESYSKHERDLAGSTGVVVTRVHPDGGSVDISSTGSMHRISAVTVSGEIAAGEKVLVISFDDEHKRFVVEQLPN
jgi:membrane protein implicated in regulation of membrane protease activity